MMSQRAVGSGLIMLGMSRWQAKTGVLSVSVVRGGWGSGQPLMSEVYFERVGMGGEAISEATIGRL